MGWSGSFVWVVLKAGMSVCFGKAGSGPAAGTDDMVWLSELKGGGRGLHASKGSVDGKRDSGVRPGGRK